MTETDKIDLLLDDYLAGRLDPSAKAKLEIDLAQDPKLQQSLALHKAANVLIREHKLKDISAITQKIHKEESSFWNKYGFWIGGGFGAILGSIVLFAVLNPSKETPLNQAVRSETNESVTNSEAATGIISTSESVETNQTNPISIPKSSVSTKAENGKGKNEFSQTQLQPVLVETKPSTELSASASVATNLESKNSDSKESHKETTPTHLICEKVVIEADIHTSPTCADGATGKIEVKSIKGGSAPYHIDYFDVHGHVVPPTETWGKGNYQLKIKDAHGCLSPSFVAIVKETVCKEDISFNPYVGEGWEGSGFGQEATIRIFDRNHGVITEKRIPKGEHHIWDGRNTKGDLAEGYFLFEITFADGGKKTGSVTVVR